MSDRGTCGQIVFHSNIGALKSLGEENITLCGAASTAVRVEMWQRKHVKERRSVARLSPVLGQPCQMNNPSEPQIFTVRRRFQVQNDASARRVGQMPRSWERGSALGEVTQR